MNFKFLFFFWSMSGILLNSCENSHADSAMDGTAIQNEILAMTDSFHRDIKTYGFTAEFAYLDTSDQFFWVIPGETKALYYDTISTIIKNNAEDFDNIDLHWKALDIHVMNSELACYTGIVEGLMHQISRDTVLTVAILESGNFIKRKDGWKFLCGQSRNQ